MTTRWSPTDKSPGEPFPPTGGNPLRCLSDALVDHRLFHPGDVVVVAVSGGADSVALLHLLDELRRTPAWQLRLVVAHLNHGLRGAESDADAEFVSHLAGKMGVGCVQDYRDISAIAAAKGLGIEEASRNERFAFFERVCLQHGASCVAVAHHADDQAETILHRVLRGTGLRGLAGMPVMRPLTPGSPIHLIRPLLNCTRADLREYLASRQIAFREDRSNADQSLMRNRIRHALLPLLEQQVNRQVRGALLRLAEQARWFENSFHENVTRTLESLLVSRTDGRIVLNGMALVRKSRLLQTGVIREAYASLGAGEAELSFAHLRDVADLLGHPASGKSIRLPGHVVAEKRYENLILTRGEFPATAAIASNLEPTPLRVPGRTVLPSRSMEICSEMLSPDQATVPSVQAPGTHSSEYLDWNAIRPPLLVRSRRPGDRFFPLGSSGTKKVSDFLADAKIFPEDRRNILLVCDQLGIIWVVGHRIDNRVKLTPQSCCVLRLDAKENHS